jgi:hypothetical protein
MIIHDSWKSSQPTPPLHLISSAQSSLRIVLRTSCHIFVVCGYPYQSSSFPRFPKVVPAATLILNCLCLCWLCKPNLSTAYPNLSFFCLSAFSLNAFSSPPPLAFTNLSRLRFFFNPFVSSFDNLPSKSSERAIKAPSRRSSFEMCDSQRARRVDIAGASSAAREACAVWRVVEGVNSKC